MSGLSFPRGGQGRETQGDIQELCQGLLGRPPPWKDPGLSLIGGQDGGRVVRSSAAPQKHLPTLTSLWTAPTLTTLDVFTLNNELPVTRGKYQSRGYDVLGTMDSDFDVKTRIPEMGKTWK